MQARTANRLLLLAAAALFSTGGAAVKATSLAGWQVASFRSGLASVALVALVPAARRGWNRRMWPVGIAYAATLVLFVLSTKLTTAANAIFLQDTGPLYLLLLGPLLLGEPIRRGDLLFLCALAGGMALIFLGADTTAATAPNPPLGNRIGALTGVTWAFTVAGLRWLGRGGEASIPSVVAGNLIAFTACLPLALPVVRCDVKDVFVLLYLGVIQIGLAYYCLTLAIRHVPAFEASTLLLLEPALNPVWTWLVHHERPSSRALAGGALILGATFLNTWWQGRRAGAARRAIHSNLKF